MKLFHQNPRTITETQFKNLTGWLQKFGDLSGVVHDLNSDMIIGGNQRSRVFNVNECEIEITESYPEPDEQGTVAIGFIVWQGKKYNYRQVRWTEDWCSEANVIANRAGGDWDFEMLANNFTQEQLLDFGFDKSELGMGDDYYTGKITSPHYEPGEMPDINTLVDEDKTLFLINHIDAAEEVTEDEKAFLRLAAYRHNVFNFKRIANYYAGASASMQRLMEENALVIIDYQDAIRLGYVALVEEITEMVRNDYGDE